MRIDVENVRIDVENVRGYMRKQADAAFSTRMNCFTTGASKGPIGVIVPI
jgi:hypothetical protein